VSGERSIFFDEAIAHVALVFDLLAWMLVEEVLREVRISRKLLVTQIAIKSVVFAPHSGHAGSFLLINLHQHFLLLNLNLADWLTVLICQLLDDVKLIWVVFRRIRLRAGLSWCRRFALLVEQELQNYLNFVNLDVKLVEIVELGEAIETELLGKAGSWWNLEIEWSEAKFGGKILLTFIFSNFSIFSFTFNGFSARIGTSGCFSFEQRRQMREDW
jgi:hypothetical protein